MKWPTSMKWPPPARSLDLAVALLGLVVLTLGCTVAALPWQPAVTPWVVAGLLLGTLARVADSRKRAALGDAIRLTALLLVAACGWATHHTAIESWFERPDHLRLPGSVFLAILARNAAPSLVALAGWTLGTSVLPFVVGASVAALVTARVVEPGPTMVVLAFALARHAVAQPDPQLSLRQRPVLIALGAVACLVALGPPFDVAAILQPAEARHADSPHLWVNVDEPWSFALRFALELGFIAAAWAFAKGRTWGLIALIVSAPLLLAALAFDVFTHRLPAWGTGCMVFTHPLELGSWFVLLGSAIAVGPWLFALGRGLSALRTPRDPHTPQTPPRSSARAPSSTHGTP